MSRMFYRGAMAAIVCYDVTDEKTWDKVKFWAGEVTRFEEDFKVYIVGNKLDLVVTFILINIGALVTFRGTLGKSWQHLGRIGS